MPKCGGEQAVLHPGAVSLQACSYSLAGLAAAGSGPAPDAGPDPRPSPGHTSTPAVAAAPRVRAGDAVLLAVTTRDRFGNAVPVAPGAVMAAANGPKGAVPFALQEVSPLELQGFVCVSKRLVSCVAAASAFAG